MSFHVDEGELLAVVGESGSGKSVAMMSLLQLLPMPPAEIANGSVLFQNRDLVKLSASEIRHVRGARIGFIFQDPMTSLNPVFTVGYQIMEPLREHMGLNKKQARDRAIELLDLVGIPAAAKRIDDYPHQFSGGMRQRVVIAIALACDPKVLIADEPTTALDVTVQAQILELVRELRHKLGMAIIWITHDLGVAAGIADRIMVMYAGQIVEHASVAELFDDPRHPYTRALLDSLPGRHTANERLRSISGQPPLLLSQPAFCPFAPRTRVGLRIPRSEPAADGEGAARRLARLGPAARVRARHGHQEEAPVQNSPPMIFESPLADRGPLRAALTRLYRADENKVVGDLVEMASLDASARSRIHEKARALTEVLRTNRPKEGGIESFMSEYQLSTQEGVDALFAAAEAHGVPSSLLASSSTTMRPRRSCSLCFGAAAASSSRSGSASASGRPTRSAPRRSRADSSRSERKPSAAWRRR